MHPFFKTTKSTFLIPPHYDTDCNSFSPSLFLYCLCLVMEIALLCKSASAIFLRAFSMSLENVVLEMPIVSAHSCWYRPSKSLSLNASISSSLMSIFSSVSLGIPQGLKQTLVWSFAIVRLIFFLPACNTTP